MPEENLIVRDSAKIIATLGNLFKRDGQLPEYEILSEGESEILITGYDNWDGGTDIYGIFCKVSIEIYSRYELEIQAIEESIKEKATRIFRSYPGWIGEVVISPELSDTVDGKPHQIDNEVLIKALENIKDVMVSVSTGGQKIQGVNTEYQSLLETVSDGLEERNIKNEIPFSDLWAWYGRWSDGSLPRYQDRRAFLASMFSPMLDAARKSQKKTINPLFEEPTGWMRVDRGMAEIKRDCSKPLQKNSFRLLACFAARHLSLSQKPSSLKVSIPPWTVLCRVKLTRKEC